MSLWALIAHVWGVLLQSQGENEVCVKLVFISGRETALELFLATDGERPFCLSSPLQKASCPVPLAYRADWQLSLGATRQQGGCQCRAAYDSSAEDDRLNAQH